MPSELIESLQATQMLLFGALEFISLLLGVSAGIALLVWLGGIAWLSYRTARRPRSRRRAALHARGSFSTAARGRQLFTPNHVSERSNSL